MKCVIIFTEVVVIKIRARTAWESERRVGIWQSLQSDSPQVARAQNDYYATSSYCALLSHHL